MPSQEILKIRDGTPPFRGGRNYDIPKKAFETARSSQEILKIRDGTPFEAEGILTYRKRPSQEILKIRDGTPFEAEGILTYRKGPRNCSVWHFSSNLDVPSNVVQEKRVARILVFKVRSSQEILKIRDGTPFEAEGILTYRKRLSKRLEILKIRDGTPFEMPSQEILKIRDGTPFEVKRVARILVFKIRPSQEILKIRDGTPFEAEGILTYRKRPSQEIQEIRDGTPLEAEGNLTYRNKPPKLLGWHFSSKLDVPSNVVQKKRVARILVFKIRPSQEIQKIRDGTPFEMPSQEILKIRDGTPFEKKRVARILVFKIRPSQEILKIRDGTPFEAEGILTYRKGPRNCSVWHFSSNLDVPSNVVQEKRVARILVFKVRSSQEILKIRDGTPFEAEGILTYRKRLSKRLVARILVFKVRSSQEILKIRDGTPFEAEGILTYRKRPSKRPSQEILKIRDGTPFEAEGILTYRKGPRNCSVWHFSSNLDVPSNVVQEKRVARILVFKVRSSQEILKIRDGTPFEAEGILTYRKRLSKRPSQEIQEIRDGTPLEAEGNLTYRNKPPKLLGWHFSSKLDVPSNVVQKKRVARILVFKIRPSQEIQKIRDEVARILVFKIRPSQEILKIRDGTPFEAEGILTYRKGPRNCSVWHFSSNLDVPSNVVQEKRVARILVFKVRSSQEILKIRDGTPFEAEGILTYRKRLSKRLVRSSQEILKIRDGTPFEAEGILTYRKRPSKRPSQEILKIRDGTPFEAEGILTYRKGPRNCSVWHFSSNLDVPSNVVQEKRVARILVFKVRSSQEILKIRDGTPFEAEGILTYRKSNVVQKKRVARILVFKIRPSQEILKIRDGTPFEAEGILTYRKGPRNCSVWHFSSNLDVPSNVVQEKRVARILVFKVRSSQEILKIRDGTPFEAEGILTYRKRLSKRLVRSSQEILKIRDGTPFEAEGILTYRKRPSQEILKIRDGTPFEAEGILTYRKGPRNCSVWHFSSNLDVPSNVVQEKRVARILVFKVRSSQEILKIRDGTPFEAEGILTYRKRLSKRLVARILVFKVRSSQEILKIRDVARILVFKIRPSQEIQEIRDGTPLEAEGNLTYRNKPPKLLGWHFSSKLDVPSNVVQKKRVARILVFKIRPSQEIQKIRDGTPFEWPSQEILKIRDGTPFEAEGILTYRKGPRNCSVWHFSSNLYVPSNVVQEKRVARILVFKVRSSQEILKIRDGTPFEAEGILTYRKRPSQEIQEIRDGTPLEAEGNLTYRNKPPKLLGWHFSSKLDVPSNVVQKKRVARILVFKIRPSQEIQKIRDGTPFEKKRVARILVFKIRPSQEILKIRDGTPFEAEGILTYRKGPRNCSVWHFSSNLDVPSNVVQEKRVARILVFKVRSSQEILKIRDGTPFEAEGILTYRKRLSKRKKRVARILVFKIRPSQEILKIRDGTPFEAEGILTYRKGPRNCSVWHFSSNLDVPSNVVQEKRVARILVFKVRSSQEILKIRDGTPFEAEGILTYRKRLSKRPSQEILKIRDGTPFEAEGILTYRKGPRNCSVWHFSSNLDVPSNVVQEKRVARILVFKVRSSQEILKIRDGTPFEAEGILTYRKRLSKRSSQEILKIRDEPSQEIQEIRDGTPLEAEGNLTYRNKPPKLLGWHFSSKLDVPSNVVQKKRVARILVFKIRPSQEIQKIRDGTPFEAEGILTYRKKPPKLLEILKIRDEPSQEILKIRDGTPFEAEGILTYRKGPRNCSVWHFSSNLYVPSNVVQEKRVARILVFKVRSSQEILKIRDGTPFEAEGILTYRKRPSQEIQEIRDGTPLEAEGNLTYRNKPPKLLGWHFSSKLDVPSNVVQKKRVARILVFKIRPSQEIQKIRDGTPFEKKRVARILVFKIRPSQEILKIRDGTPFEAEGILTYRKGPRNCSVWHFSSNLDVPSNVVQEKRVARILVFKVRSSQEILKIRDGTPFEAEGILTYRKRLSKRPSQEILKIRDGTPFEAEGILTYRKGPRNCSVWHFSSNLDVPSNVVQEKRVARILVFKVRSSQEILKIRDGTPFEAEGILTYRKRLSKRNVVQKKRVARILVFKIRPSQEILKIRDGTPFEAEGILTYRKGPRNCSVWHFSSNLDVPSNVVHEKRVARILVFKVRSSQEILKIRDGTPFEAEGILTYRKRLSKRLVRSSQEILKIRDGTPFEAEGILTYRKRPSQEILKIRDGTPFEAEGILTYRKGPRNCSVWHFSSNLDVPSNVVQEKRVARILVFKVRSSQEILKIRDGTPFEAEGILTYRKRLSKRVARILVFKVRSSQEILKIRDEPSQEILKIRDGTPFEAEGILTYRKGPRNCSVWHFSSNLDVPSNVVQEKRVARILVFKVRSSQEILKIRDGTPFEAEGILTYRKRVARILVFKIRPSQEILKIRDGTPFEAEGILTYRKGPRNCSVWHFSSNLDVPSNVVQEKRVARILVFKVRSSQEILKIRDGTPFEAEGILTYRKRLSKRLVRSSQEILKIRDGTPFEAEGILTYRKRPSKRPSQEILKIRDGTPFEAEGILTYRKGPRNCSVWHFSSNLDVPSNVVQEKRVARILVFKVRSSQEILKIRDGTPFEAEGILTYRKRLSKRSSQEILKIRDEPSQEIQEIRDGTPLEAEGNLTYRNKPPKLLGWHFSSKLDVPSNVVQKKRVARILVFKIRPSQEIQKIRDGTPFEWPSQEILKIRDGTPFEAEGILTYRKGPRNCSVWHFSSNLYVPSNVVQEKRVARILVFKVRSSQEILKIRDGTPFEAEGILTYRKRLSKRLVARILVFKVRSSQEILKIRDVARILVFKIRPSQEIQEIRDGTPLEAEGNLTYRNKPPKLLGWHFSSKLDVPSNVVQKKRVARILVFKIRPSQEIQKIRDGTPFEMPSQEILKIRDGTPPFRGGRNFDIPKKAFETWPSQEIQEIRDGTPLEAEGNLTYRNKPPKLLGWHFSSKLDVPSNVVQKKRVARILVFKIRPSQEIQKIRDGTPFEWPSQEILKIRDGTPFEAEGILTYRKGPRNCSVWHFSSNLYVPSNVVQEKRVARILVFKVRSSQEILKIRDGTPFEAEGILTYRKRLSKRS
ncbi:hypothetical protein OROMI_030937 [Orobanche minor]